MLITDNGRVKLMDFAWRGWPAAIPPPPLFGTPAYWCPSKSWGNRRTRAPIFLLGVVLYEMVTGKRPFDADSLQGICGRVLSSTPLPPSHCESFAAAAFDGVVPAAWQKNRPRVTPPPKLSRRSLSAARHKVIPQSAAANQRQWSGDRAARLLARMMITLQKDRYEALDTSVPVPRSRRKSAGQRHWPHRRHQTFLNGFGEGLEQHFRREAQIIGQLSILASSTVRRRIDEQGTPSW